jgi:hypothetical protein
MYAFSPAFFNTLHGPVLCGPSVREVNAHGLISVLILLVEVDVHVV